MIVLTQAEWAEILDAFRDALEREFGAPLECSEPLPSEAPAAPMPLH